MLEFSAYEVRHMLLVIRNWLYSGEQCRGVRRDGYVTLQAEVVESLGSNVGLDGPTAHRLVAALIEEGYLEGEYPSTDSCGTFLGYAEIRSMTEKAIEEMG